MSLQAGNCIEENEVLLMPYMVNFRVRNHQIKIAATFHETRFSLPFLRLICPMTPDDRYLNVCVILTT